MKLNQLKDPFQIAKIAVSLGWSALGFALVFHLWAASRGLEMTDEASYLLIALDPWKTWGHGTFHGFLLRPLYLLGGESVVGLRWIGYATLLVGASRLAGAIRLHLGPGREGLTGFCLPVLMVASLTSYTAGIRTPCYNWMILFGGMLAWSGWLRCGRGRIGPMELGLGLTIACLGKWGGALILLAVFAILSLFREKDSAGPSQGDWGKALLAFASATAGFAMYAGFEGIWDTLQAGVLIARTTRSHGWFLGPKYAWEIFYYFYRIGRAFVWLLPAILLFWWLAKKNPRKWTTSKIATILFSGGLLLAAGRGWWRGGIEQFGKESVLSGCWLLGVVWTVWAVRRRADISVKRTEGKGPQMVEGVPSSVLWGLVLTPFLSGIGTNTSIADYAGQGTVFFAAAGISMMGSLTRVQLRSWACVALTGICLLQSSRVSSSLLGMYRVGSVMRQTVPLAVGPETGKLRIDSATARQIQELSKTMEGLGFRVGNPVVGVDSLCGWVYLIGGKSPGVPWFFAGQKSYLENVLKKLSKEILDETWVLTRSGSSIKNLKSWWHRADVQPPAEKGIIRGLKAGSIQLEDIVIYAPVHYPEPFH